MAPGWPPSRIGHQYASHPSLHFCLASSTWACASTGPPSNPNSSSSMAPGPFSGARLAAASPAPGGFSQAPLALATAVTNRAGAPGHGGRGCSRSDARKWPEVSRRGIADCSKGAVNHDDEMDVGRLEHADSGVEQPAVPLSAKLGMKDDLESMDQHFPAAGAAPSMENLESDDALGGLEAVSVEEVPGMRVDAPPSLPHAGFHNELEDTAAHSACGRARAAATGAAAGAAHPRAGRWASAAAFASPKTSPSALSRKAAMPVACEVPRRSASNRASSTSEPGL